MDKSSISITLDRDVFNELNGTKNKSQKVSELLRYALLTKEGIKGQIENHKLIIEQLEKKLMLMEKREQDLLRNIPESLKLELRKVKDILKEHPDKEDIWIDILNRNFKLNINKDILSKLIEKV